MAAVFVASGAPAFADLRPQPAAAAGADEALIIALTEAKADIERGDVKHAREILDKASARKTFEASNPKLRRAVMLMVAALAYEGDDLPAARTAIVSASEMADAEAFDWSLRLQIASKAHDLEDIIKSMTVLATRYPATLGEFDDSFIYNTRNRARLLPDGEAKAFALDEAMVLGGWAPDDPFTDNSTLWRDYARGLLTRGRTADAEKIIGRIVDREVLMSMRADMLFDAVGGAGPDRLSPRIAALAWLKTVDDRIKEHPTLLSGQAARAEALLQLNRSAEALAVTEAAIARANADPKAYADLDDMLPWTHDLENKALKRLGRNDEALAALAAGARVPEHGKANVNQTLNLAGAQSRLGRPREALATVATVRLDRMSPYGRSVALSIKAIAATQLGDKAAADKATAELSDLGAEGKLNLLDVLTYRGDLDGAAALVIARLADPLQRSEALTALQDTPAHPFPTAYDLEMRKQEDALRSRPDIQAAAAKVGRILRYAPGDLWPVS